MILTWMLAATLFTLCVGVAAAAVDPLVRARRSGARGVWLAALAVAVTWPVLVPVVRPLVTPPAAELVVFAAPAALPSAGVEVPITESAPWWSRVGAALSPAAMEYPARRAVSLLGRFDSLALGAWLVLSGVLLVRLLRAAGHVRRLAREAVHTTVDGEPVLLADGFGPASVGWRAPRVVLPPWVLALDAPLRALVLRHEREHCRTGDPRQMWIAAFATALMPWNAGLWWITRRLRLALELDCDARTLRPGGDPLLYAKLLLFMTQQHPVPASRLRLASSLIGSRSHLGRRIRAMQRPFASSPRVRFAFGAVAALAVIGACGTHIPGNLLTANIDERSAARLADSVTVASNVDTPYAEFQVEQTAALERSGGMVYPEMLRSAQVEGTVLASFVVDENGRVDPSTFTVLRSDHELFTTSVRNALRTLHYQPARVGGQPVKQLVQIPFVFQIDRTFTRDSLRQTRPAERPVRDSSDRRIPFEVRAMPLVRSRASSSAVRAASDSSPYFESQVEQPATMRRAARLVYPEMLKSAQVEGRVIARFIVGTDGLIDRSSFTVMQSSHPLFTTAVRNVIADLVYEPARVGGVAVEQVVHQPFDFQLAR